MLPLANTAVLGKGATRQTGITDATAQYYSSVSLEHRQELGQFYTPVHLIEKMLETIHIPKSAAILEPSFGSGEFFQVLLREGYTNITGVELEDKFFIGEAETKTKWESKGIRVIHSDFLKYKPADRFDLVFANPPYLRDLYAKILVHSISLTKPGGILSFLIPSTLLTGTSFQKYRTAIHKECNIERVYVHGNRKEFAGADVEVMIIQLRKTTPSMDFCRMVDGKVLFMREKEGTDTECKYVSDLLSFNQGKTDNGLIKDDARKALSDTKTADNLLFIQAFNFADGGIQTSKVPKSRKLYLLRSFKPASIEKAPFIAIKHTIGTDKKFMCALIREGEYYMEHHTIIGRAKNMADLEKAYQTLSDTEYMKEQIKEYNSRSLSISFLKSVCLKP